MELVSGSVIGGRYVIDEQIGEGGMAVVYRAHHVQLHTRHAVKVLTIRSRTVKERMLQEGRVQAQLRHPNVVSVTDVVEVEGSPALVMELIDGPALDELIVQQKLTIEQADTIGRGILSAVTYAHERGLIHRDLKPANVMLEIEGGTVKPMVTDFGLAKLLDGDEKAAATRTGSTMGTPQYMSPEQITDTKNVDARSDVFALGAILYELVTGERAFDGDNVLKIFHKVTEVEYVPIRQLRPDAPERMVRAVEAALVYDLDKRIATARELFEVFTDGEPLPATSFTSSELAAMTGNNRPSSITAPSAATTTADSALAPVAHTLTATSIVRSPVVIGGGLFAFGAIALAAVLLLGGGVALYVVLQPDDVVATAEPLAPEPGVPEPVVLPQPDAPTDEPTTPKAPDDGVAVVVPEPTPAPEPTTPAPQTPVEKPLVEDPTAVAPEPVVVGEDAQPPEVPIPEPIVEPVQVLVPVPVPVAPVAQPDPAPTNVMTIDNVPASMRSNSTSGPAAIWARRDDREKRMNTWLVILMKDRQLQTDARVRAVESLAHRLSGGLGPIGVAETGLHWAARYGPRSSPGTALRALGNHGTRLDGPIGALNSSSDNTQSKALDALSSIARRANKQAEAKAALTTYVAKSSVSNKNKKQATELLGSL